MSNVHLRTGSEGPRHDPYHYDKFTLARPNGDTITIHIGLGAWCQVQRNGKVALSNEGEQPAMALFEQYSGAPYHIAERAYWRNKRRQQRRKFHEHTCRPRQFICQEGYPGESFEVCAHCGEVMDYHFNRSAIE